MKSFGIRRETKSIWERRTPIIPSDAKEIIEKYEYKLYVQPSEIRIFKDEEYKNIGAILDEKLDTEFIFGIKEIPPDFFEFGKKYVFFSHTIKGQKHNMPMLKRMLELKTTLIDYEKITDEKGRRLIAFGRFAGIAGMIDTLWAFGRRLEYEGLKTPFLKVRRAYEYYNLQKIKDEFKKIKEEIKEGLSKEISPLTIGILGYGNVSSGVQEILNLLDVKYIKPDEVPAIKGNDNEIYASIFKEEDLVERKDGKNFNLEEYYHSPELYKSRFETFIPYLSMIVNCIYWDQRYPRFITKDYFRDLYSKGKPKIKVIGDISCDINGSVEFTQFAEEPDKPCYVYEPLTGNFKFGFEGEGVVVVAVDILPSELPRDASIYFSGILKSFLPKIIEAKYPEDFKNCTLPEFLKNGVIVYRGELTEKYKYIEKYL
uniref:Alanine dehydrogenase n=1 Tax=candidate division WOR-3 bacterium TaxID=2052148 RepID=A0A7C4U8D3_UNCW3